MTLNVSEEVRNSGLSLNINRKEDLEDIQDKLKLNNGSGNPDLDNIILNEETLKAINSNNISVQEVIDVHTTLINENEMMETNFYESYLSSKNTKSTINQMEMIKDDDNNKNEQIKKGEEKNMDFDDLDDDDDDEKFNYYHNQENYNNRDYDGDNDDDDDDTNNESSTSDSSHVYLSISRSPTFTSKDSQTSTLSNKKSKVNKKSKSNSSIGSHYQKDDKKNLKKTPPLPTIQKVECSHCNSVSLRYTSNSNQKNNKKFDKKEEEEEEEDKNQKISYLHKASKKSLDQVKKKVNKIRKLNMERQKTNKNKEEVVMVEVQPQKPNLSSSTLSLSNSSLEASKECLLSNDLLNKRMSSSVSSLKMKNQMENTSSNPTTFLYKESNENTITRKDIPPLYKEPSNKDSKRTKTQNSVVYINHQNSDENNKEKKIIGHNSSLMDKRMPLKMIDMCYVNECNKSIHKKDNLLKKEKNDSFRNEGLVSFDYNQDETIQNKMNCDENSTYVSHRMMTNDNKNQVSITKCRKEIIRKDMNNNLIQKINISMKCSSNEDLNKKEKKGEKMLAQQEQQSNLYKSQDQDNTIPYLDYPSQPEESPTDQDLRPSAPVMEMDIHSIHVNSIIPMEEDHERIKMNYENGDGKIKSFQSQSLDRRNINKPTSLISHFDSSYTTTSSPKKDEKMFDKYENFEFIQNYKKNMREYEIQQQPPVTERDVINISNRTNSISATHHNTLQSINVKKMDNFSPTKDSTYSSPISNSSHSLNQYLDQRRNSNQINAQSSNISVVANDSSLNKESTNPDQHIDIHDQEMNLTNEGICSNNNDNDNQSNTNVRPPSISKSIIFGVDQFPSPPSNDDEVDITDNSKEMGPSHNHNSNNTVIHAYYKNEEDIEDINDLPPSYDNLGYQNEPSAPNISELNNTITYQPKESTSSDGCCGCCNNFDIIMANKFNISTSTVKKL